MRQKRAYRYRCYPTATQAAVLARTFGCARYVYNWALRLRTDVYHERQERLSYQDASAALTQLKQQPETAWLNEVVQCADPASLAPSGDRVSQFL
jgi:putative transposase